MWVEIAKDTFEKSEFKSLNFLFQILSWSPSNEMPRYNIFVNTERVKSFENFKILSAVENSLKQLLDAEFDNFVNSKPSNTERDYKITYNKSATNFNIEEAITFFNQPVSIILENNKNDSAFIISVIEHFGKNDGINKSQIHFDNNWLKFENAGGCSNIPNFMEMFLKQFQRLAFKNQRPLADYFRGLIIIDSDKEFINQSSKHNSLIQSLNDLGISNNQIHILQKRMMENYMPDEVFTEIKSQLHNNLEIVNWIDAYLNLDENKKNYVNIPDGFPPKKNKFEANGNRKNIDDEILTFFGFNLNDINFNKLDKGFNFKGFNNTGEFKNEFPKLFKKQLVNKLSLNVRDGENELEKIVQKINDLL
ncbi:hypothetical protein LVDJXP189_40003 [Flavobacterium psychrophilum]|uniref:Uncharacterized protein n=1 Tax=Flavobacterium psychrophilum TaxID=96345 RepID=A0A7U2NDP5_FLAPS|nr:hypothetical protein [Flavobacterium psychrophilum]OAE93470.1 hypothetical protein SU65_03550 [Flavobacterium psychrophilum]OJH13548.1 hypothetical protein FPG87_08010 [Flavobacterium psychrophilum]QRE03265.1 hypothetical protein H0H26_10195 [Flavobacterium psychrophilum]SNA87556.1 hypothetical protein DK150_80003 [Flavobacterium psychrophilum]SNB43480.1 hypothetical protein LVDJXP189_40003 [Flavobacterium psychrophilum]